MDDDGVPLLSRAVGQACIDAYANKVPSRRGKPNAVGTEYTHLAGFVAVHRDTKSVLRVLSLGTGTKVVSRLLNHLLHVI